MNSRSRYSRTPWRRSQSLTCRWTCGRGTRRRSLRGGKSSTGATTSPPSLPLLPLPPHQVAVGQHHRHRMPVEPGPQPPLVLVPAQQPLRLLVELLHPIAPVGVLHHPLQRHPPSGRSLTISERDQKEARQANLHRIQRDRLQSIARWPFLWEGPLGCPFRQPGATPGPARSSREG